MTTDNDKTTTNPEGQPNIIRDNTNITPYDKDGKSTHFARVDCKLCNSKYKEEAEARFDSLKISGTPSYKEVERLLVERGENISYPAIRNHLIFHHMSSDQAKALAEFGDKVRDWRDFQGDKFESLTRRICILENEMATIAAMSQGLPLETRRKNSETVAKLASVILSYEGTLKEFEKDREPVAFIMEQLRVIIEEEIKTQPTEVKRVLVNILDQLQERANRKGYTVRQGK